MLEVFAITEMVPEIIAKGGLVGTVVLDGLIVLSIFALAGLLWIVWIGVSSAEHRGG